MTFEHHHTGAPMKILISDNLEQSCIDILVREGFTVDNRPGLPAAELLSVIGQYEALVVRSATKVNAEVIARASAMKVIGRAGTGVDNIDVAAATRKGILVMNTPGGNTVSAAEHTVSMMLSLARNIPQANASLVRGEWERKKFTGMEVFEKTLGVIGLGKIGREVAQRCKGLGMNIVAYDPVLAPEVAAREGIELAPLEEIYRRADVITVHTPLTADTKNLLNDATLARCKKGVRIINCARGGIVEEAALLRALESGQVGGAAIDVFESEPPKNTALIAHPRVVATPHLGASTEEAQEKVAVQIAHQIADALKGRAFAGVVNGAAMQLTLKEEVRPYVLMAEKLGHLAAQLAPGKVKRISLVASGEPIVSTLDLLKAGVLKGILNHTHPEPVNFINAPFLAKELGLTIVESKEEGAAPVPQLKLAYETEQETRECAGAVYGSRTVKLVMIDGFRFEVTPEGTLLFYYNVDRPGMLAKVGTILAKHQVNIAGVSLGRSEMGGKALTVMNVDNAIPAAAIEELGRMEGFHGLRVVNLE
jgi:D-3-phosphoglycerate dehydrogenase / 2-oxoglutarate reductase